jgi:hypothetical protein
MTQIDKEAVERLAQKNETCAQKRSSAPLMIVPDPLGAETADTLRTLRAALDIAEAENRKLAKSFKKVELIASLGVLLSRLYTPTKTFDYDLDLAERIIATIRQETNDD